MWTQMTERLAALAREISGMPEFSQSMTKVRRCTEAVAALAVPLQTLSNDVHGHAERSRETLTGAQLEIGRWSAGSPAKLREMAAHIVADARRVQGLASAQSAVVARNRTEVGAAAGELVTAATEARGRLKVLEQRQRELMQKIVELRNRSAWTWLFLPAKAIDELVSVFQNGKSTEAALEDALREIADKQREASQNIRAADLATSQVALLEQMALRLQGVVNQLGLLDAHLSGEQNLARFDDPATAKVMVAALLQLVRMLDAEMA